MANQNNSNKTALWIRIMCIFLAALMVFGIVSMIISLLSSRLHADEETALDGSYTVSDTEISVGLCYDSSAAQSYTLSAPSPLSVRSRGLSYLDVSSKLTVCFDGNEYIYDGEITDNPTGVSVLGGYHVRISYLRAGSTSSSDNDNPVFITPDASGGAAGDNLFTKDNIDEYISTFNASEAAQKLGVYAFPSYFSGKYYICIGDCNDEDEAEELLSELRRYYVLNADIYEPKDDVLTVHTAEYDIVLKTDDKYDVEIFANNGSVLSGDNNAEYYGYFRFYRDNMQDRPGIEVINTLAIDDYVKSVMSIELSHEYPAEMLKASAVMFRTAAYKKLIDHEKREFDVCANTHCQKYVGCSAVSERISNAVDAVENVVAIYGKELIYPVYSLSCKSTTVSSYDAIGKEYPYLQSIKTNWEMVDEVYEDWKVSISPSALYAKLKGKGYDELEASIRSVTVDSRSEGSLYATSVTFTDVLGNTVTIKGSENIRAALDGIVDSSAFIVGKSGSEVSFEYYAESGESVSATRKMEGIVGNFVFSGEGEGSGIGLSLSGARVLAEQGQTYDAILKTYYQGIKLAEVKLD